MLFIRFDYSIILIVAMEVNLGKKKSFKINIKRGFVLKLLKAVLFNSFNSK